MCKRIHSQYVKKESESNDIFFRNFRICTKIMEALTLFKRNSLIRIYSNVPSILSVFVAKMFKLAPQDYGSSLHDLDKNNTLLFCKKWAYMKPVSKASLSVLDVRTERRKLRTLLQTKHVKILTKDPESTPNQTWIPCFANV